MMNEVIRNINGTVLVIAHDMSIIQNMDKIMVLQNGELIEYGSHLELLNFKGVYAEMFSTC